MAANNRHLSQNTMTLDELIDFLDIVLTVVVSLVRLFVILIAVLVVLSLICEIDPVLLWEVL